MTTKIIKKEHEKIHGNRIRILLKEKGITQQEFADMTGLGASHLSKIILGKRRCISLPIAFKIAACLNMQVEDVFIPKVVKKTIVEDDAN